MNMLKSTCLNDEVVFFTPIQIGYFFTRFANKKVPCFIVVSFLVSINSSSPSTTLVAYKIVANC